MIVEPYREDCLRQASIVRADCSAASKRRTCRRPASCSAKHRTALSAIHERNAPPPGVERKARASDGIRVQDGNNQFINGSREILRTGPNAYYK